MTWNRGAFPVLLITSGLIVWASCFVVLYAGLSLGCRYGPPAFSMLGMEGINWILLFLWIIHLAVLGWLVMRSYVALKRASTTSGRFVMRSTLLLQGVGLVGSVWIGFPILMVPACA